MEINIENLNTIYREQLAEFLSVIDITNMNEIKNRVVSEISNYFNRGFQNLILYDLSEIEDKIVEVFRYGIDRSISSKEHTLCYSYDTVQNFDRKNTKNQEERQQVIQKFDVNNPANHFADLTDRIVALIDSNLAKKNWNNENYAKYQYQIKINLRKYIDYEKNKMLEDIKERLIEKDKKVEKEILSSYKELISAMERNANLDIMKTSVSSFLNFPNQEVFPPISEEDNSYGSLPGDIIK